MAAPGFTFFEPFHTTSQSPNTVTAKQHIRHDSGQDTTTSTTEASSDIIPQFATLTISKTANASKIPKTPENASTFRNIASPTTPHKRSSLLYDTSDHTITSVSTRRSRDLSPEPFLNTTSVTGIISPKPNNARLSLHRPSLPRKSSLKQSLTSSPTTTPTHGGPAGYTYTPVSSRTPGFESFAHDLDTPFVQPHWSGDPWRLARKKKPLKPKAKKNSQLRIQVVRFKDDEEQVADGLVGTSAKVVTEGVKGLIGKVW